MNNAPYGWQRDPGNPAVYIPDDDEAETVAIILEMRDQGDSWAAIARALDAAGVSCRGAANWTHTQVGRIIRRESHSRTPPKRF